MSTLVGNNHHISKEAAMHSIVTKLVTEKKYIPALKLVMIMHLALFLPGTKQQALEELRDNKGILQHLAARKLGQIKKVKPEDEQIWNDYIDYLIYVVSEPDLLHVMHRSKKRITESLHDVSWKSLNDHLSTCNHWLE